MYVLEVQMLDHNGRHSINFVACVNKDTYLHSDGRVLSTREYFPTKEDAQKVLDKFYPKPKHEWKHGDVFLSNGREEYPMVYIHIHDREPQVFHLRWSICSPYGLPATGRLTSYLKSATFLFNIKEKIQ